MRLRLNAGESYRLNVGGKQIVFTKGSPEQDVPDEEVERLHLLDETCPSYGKEGEHAKDEPRFKRVEPAREAPARAERGRASAEK